jgi:hypothetical protein
LDAKFVGEISFTVALDGEVDVEVVGEADDLDSGFEGIV